MSMSEYHKCLDCGSIFEHDEVVVTEYPDVGFTEYTCPSCGSDDYISAEECPICFEIKPLDDMTIAGGACIECMTKIRDKAIAALKAALEADEYAEFAEHYEIEGGVI